MKKTDLVGLVLIILFVSGLSCAQGNLNIEEQKAKSAFMLNDLGIAHLKAELYNEALEDFKQSIALKPNFANPYNNLAMTYKLLGQTGLARAALQRAIHIDPNYAEAHFNLGVLYDNERSYEAAVESLKLAILLQPDFAQAHNSLGVAYSDWGRRAEAVNAYRQAIRLKPDYAEAYNNLGTIEVERGRFEQGISAFMLAIELKPKLALAHYNLGVAFLKMKNREAALEQQRLLSGVDDRLANKLFDGIYRGKVLHVGIR